MFKILKNTISIILVIIVLMAIVMLYSRMKENFEDDIDPNKKEYEDALDKRIAEVKFEHPRFDAELLLDVNKPYRTPREDELGWWADIVSGRTNPDIYHKKNPKDWIFPY